MIKGVARIQVPGRIAEIEAVVEDISLGGMAVYAMEALPAATEAKIDIDIRCPRGEVIRDKFHGKVAWTKELGGFTLHGIVFARELTEGEHPGLYPYLD